MKNIPIIRKQCIHSILRLFPMLRLWRIFVKKSFYRASLYFLEVCPDPQALKLTPNPQEMGLSIHSAIENSEINTLEKLLGYWTFSIQKCYGLNKLQT